MRILIYCLIYVRMGYIDVLCKFYRVNYVIFFVWVSYTFFFVIELKMKQKIFNEKSSTVTFFLFEEGVWEFAIIWF